MEARLLLGEIPKLFAIVFMAVFCLRKLSGPMSPEGKMNAKSAEMSQGSGSEMRVKMIQGNFITVRRLYFNVLPFVSITDLTLFGYQEIYREIT